MKSIILKIVFSLCFIFQFHLFETKLFAQQKDSILPLKPLLSKKETRPFKVSPNINYDSLDNSDFCKNKVKELFYLRTKLFAKIDSANEILIKLKENNPGNIYYLEVSEKELFNYEGCFWRKNTRSSHGLDGDVIDLELRIKEEGQFHNNSDGSSGWTIYRDEIQRAPK
jgi:hypothetical protein